jgi:hypothetical protein
MEFNEANFNALLAESAELKSKLKGVNDEAKGHRLSAESFRSQADDFRTKFTESASAIEDMKKGHAAEIEKFNLEHGAKQAAADKAVADAKEAASKRVLMAELKVVASSKGILDLDYLKLLDTSAVKMDDHGDVLNADEVVEAFKTSKPHMFGNGKKPGVETGTTTAKKPAPKPDPSGQKFDALAATDAEFDAAVKGLGRRR